MLVRTTHSRMTQECIDPELRAVQVRQSRYCKVDMVNTSSADVSSTSANVIRNILSLAYSFCNELVIVESRLSRGVVGTDTRRENSSTQLQTVFIQKSDLGVPHVL